MPGLNSALFDPIPGNIFGEFFPVRDALSTPEGFLGPDDRFALNFVAPDPAPL